MLLGTLWIMSAVLAIAALPTPALQRSSPNVVRTVQIKNYAPYNVEVIMVVECDLSRGYYCGYKSLKMEKKNRVRCYH